jgi:hypothetical protein
LNLAVVLATHSCATRAYFFVSGTGGGRIRHDRRAISVDDPRDFSKRAVCLLFRDARPGGPGGGPQDHDGICAKRESYGGAVQNQFALSSGQYVYLQVFYAMPLIGAIWLPAVTATFNGKTVKLVSAAAAFKNEPYQSTYTSPAGC